MRHQVAGKWSVIDYISRSMVDQEQSCACPLCGFISAANTLKQFNSNCIFGGGLLLRYQCPNCDLIFGPKKMLDLTPAELSSDYEWHYRVYDEGDSTAQEIRAFHCDYSIMSFVSYAQNFEDVMLWRALKHVENGFYIDVGANDPTVDSVTKAFYERGWHGINIEPLPSHHADLQRDRPRDINLQCAAGASNGEIEVWECDVRGWATASADVMAQHTASGHKGAFHKVPVFRLADICAQHVSGKIHFLKIDVEGFEKSVIDGADFSRFRPWILVIEATKPNSTEEIHGEWESTVLSADYDLGYTDGLNRFYVAKEHDELRDSLRYPPNVFDEFIRSEQLDSELRAQQAETKAQQAETKAQQAETKAQQAETKAQQAETKAQQAETKAQQAEAASNERFAQLQAVYASTSWRLTKPIRAFKQDSRR